MMKFQTSRRLFIKTVGTATFCTPIFEFWGCKPSGSKDLGAAIAKIGNSEDEQDRYALTLELLKRPDLPAAIRNQLESLLTYMDQWANGKKLASEQDARYVEKAYLSDVIKNCRLDQNIPPLVPATSPVYPLWCLYRGRMLVWAAIEYGDIVGVPETRTKYHLESLKLLKQASTAFTDNNTLKMYLGERFQWPDFVDIDHEAAPVWTVLQRSALNGLRKIIHWWIDQRQLPDGQYGGGWGDDVEMWRWWTPLLVGVKDDKINQAQRKLSEGLFRLPHMKNGYTSLISDVEHTAEDSADTITAMMHLAPNEEVWQDRAMHLAQLMKEKWTGINERGQLQFKSTYFTADDIDLTPRKACDTVYHPRAIQPALLLWQRTGDQYLGDLFTSWLTTWADASMREENGKPAGIVPSAIHWPDGRVGGLNKEWWKPGNYTDNPLYVWPSSMSMMLNSLLLAWHMTGDDRYVQPIRSMAEIRLEYIKNPPVSVPAAGSKDWCAERMGGFLSGVISKYRLITGDLEYDELLQKEQRPYDAFAFFGEEQAMIRQLNETHHALSHNWPCFTSEVRWTDRVLSFNKNYLRYIDVDQAPIPDTHLLYSMLTGDPGDPLYFPLNGFQWIDGAEALATRVLVNEMTNAEIELFLFDENPARVSVQAFLLQAGQYSMQLRSADGDVILNRPVFIKQEEKVFEVPVPGNQPVVLRLNKLV